MVMRVFVQRGWGSDPRFFGHFQATTFAQRARRAALLAAAVVVLLPLVLLMLCAIVAGAVTFVAYLLVARARAAIRSWFAPRHVAPSDDTSGGGRRNVTVIMPDD